MLSKDQQRATLQLLGWVPLRDTDAPVDGATRWLWDFYRPTARAVYQNLAGKVLPRGDEPTARHVPMEWIAVPNSIVEEVFAQLVELT